MKKIDLNNIITLENDELNSRDTSTLEKEIDILFGRHIKQINSNNLTNSLFRKNIFGEQPVIISQQDAETNTEFMTENVTKKPEEEIISDKNEVDEKDDSSFLSDASNELILIKDIKSENKKTSEDWKTVADQNSRVDYKELL